MCRPVQYTAFMTHPSTTYVVARKRPGRSAFWLGVACAVLGPALYMAQLKMGRLVVPWYLPILGTVGFLFMFAALGRARSIGRVALVGVLGLLAAGEWFAVVSFSRLPAYTGPATVGKPFPAFATAWADGSPFTQANVSADKNTIVVFFRGRW